MTETKSGVPPKNCPRAECVCIVSHYTQKVQNSSNGMKRCLKSTCVKSLIKGKA